MKRAEDSWAFRDGLRRDLRAALKSRQPETISALRTMIAAVDNAEAIQPDTDSARPADGVIAHSSPGVGSTEAPRRVLHMTDIQAIVVNLLAEYDTQAEHYHYVHQSEAAERLRRQASILLAYLEATGARPGSIRRVRPP
ncbi:hypothetical protein ACRU43_22590 [Mycobacterium colombiense]|nr:hypothetical protein [Mycobacterium colombiense]